MADVREQFEEMLIRHVTSLSERMGGLERTVSDMRSTQVQMHTTVQRMDQTLYGERGTNGMRKDVQEILGRLDELETGETAEQSRQKAVRRIVAPIITIIISIIGSITTFFIITASRGCL